MSVVYTSQGNYHSIIALPAATVCGLEVFTHSLCHICYHSLFPRILAVYYLYMYSFPSKQFIMWLT